MKNRNAQKLEVITPSTLIVGVDIAKELQWARFVDYRGLEFGKALKFRNNKNGFESILASIEANCKNKGLNNVIVGMEPTGHYWRQLFFVLLQIPQLHIM
jgi:transposase